MQTTPKRLAALFAHFLGNERPHRLFGPLVSHPQQDPAFQIVDDRKVDLPFTTAHLIDANRMYRGLRNIPARCCFGSHLRFEGRG
jgi:hypothetical protein